jgi:hypothetical protein
MSPALDQDLGLEQRIEELAIEKFGAKFPVERFDITILPRASGLDEKGAHAGVLGNWVVIQVNGLPSKLASSVVAIGQSDPTKITRVYPLGRQLPTGASWASPRSAVDAENSMVYSADLGMRKVAAVSSSIKPLLR